MSNSDWKFVKLGDLIDITHGYAFKGEFFREAPPGDILLSPGNFAVGGGFKSDKLKYYVGDVPEDFILFENDLLVTMTDLSKAADTLGYPALLPQSPKSCHFLHNQRLGKVIIKFENLLNKYYLYYRLRTDSYRNEVLASATGTTVKHTSPNHIKKYQFHLPPLREQKAIAHILGTLDDKIELNQQMNQTLEAIAKAIFKSWFVDFDPVRAKMEGRQPVGIDAATAELFPDSFEESALGLIPRGWRVVQLPEIIQVNPTRSLSKGQIAPYLDMKNMPTQGHRPDNWINRPFGSGTKFINGDTLIARITPCLENGKTAFVDFLENGQVGWGSTEYIIFRPKPPLPLEFAYYLARSEDLKVFAIQNMTGSSGRQRTPSDCFWNYLIALPSKEVAIEFEKIVKSLMTKITSNSKQSHTLSITRDTLLPKLMSGEIRVKERIPRIYSS